jgi:hypothetical protein
MSILNHPNFSLFCFMLNVWFTALNIATGSYGFAIFCGLCAALCIRNYMVLKSK